MLVDIWWARKSSTAGHISGLFFLENLTPQAHYRHINRDLPLSILCSLPG